MITTRSPISRRAEQDAARALDRLCNAALEMVKAQEAEIDQLEYLLHGARQRKQWLLDRYVKPIAEMV